MYKKGVENKVANALSRVPSCEKEGQLTQATGVSPNWLADLSKNYENDEEALKIIAAISTKDPNYAQFQYSQGIIKRDGKVYVGSKRELRKLIMWELHDGPHGGHSGQDAT